MPADAGESSAQKVTHHIVQPVFIGATVGIGESNDVACTGRDPGISRSRKTQVWLADITELRMKTRDFRGAVGRTVVDQNYFIIRVIKCGQGIEAGFQRSRAVVSSYHHRHLCIMRQSKMRSRVIELLHHGKGRLWLALPCSQAEAPILNLLPAAMPVIGKAENDRAGDSRAKRSLNLPCQDLAFDLFAFADRVDAKLSEQQRLRIRNHLQPREIIVECFRVMEVNIETDEIDIAGV